MLRPLHPQDQRFLNDLSRINHRLADAQKQLTTGKRMLQVSDDPDQVSELLNARTQLSSTVQIRTNLGMLKTEVDTAELSIANALRGLERARVLAAQGLTGTQTAETRLTIATELEGIIHQVVGTTRTNVNGRYLFSGDTDDVLPFSYVSGPPPSVTAYAGSSATRMALDPTGQAFRVSMAGDELFQNADPAKNALSSLTDLHAALIADNPDAIGQALQRLESAQDHLNQSLAFYGSIQNRVNQSIDLAAAQELRLKERISRTEDTDATEAILEMTQAAFQQDAVLSSRARMPKRSLFDYLS